MNYLFFALLAGFAATTTLAQAGPMPVGSETMPLTGAPTATSPHAEKQTAKGVLETVEVDKTQSDKSSRKVQIDKKNDKTKQ